MFVLKTMSTQVCLKRPDMDISIWTLYMVSTCIGCWGTFVKYDSEHSSTLKWEMYYRWFNRIFSIYKLILDILLLRSARYPHPIAWNYLWLFGGIFRPDKCFSLYFVSDFIGCSCLRFPYSSCRYPEACQGGNCVEKHRDATRDRTQDLLLTKRTRYLCAIWPPSPSSSVGRAQGS